MKKNEGITLIALIITIVILIILTAVTINNVMNTDLFDLAKGAAVNYIQAGKEEENVINEIMSTAGEIGGDPKLSDLVTAENYGDYVDYSVDIGTTLLNGKDEGKNLDYDWKIFYNDGTHVFIIADDYVPVVKDPAKTAIGKAGMTENGTYNAYWDDEALPEFKEIDSKILTLFKATPEIYKLTDSYKNSKCVSQLLETTNWEGFVNRKYADYAIGEPTLEMWCDSWNNNLKNKENSEFKEIKVGKPNDYGYTVSCGNIKDETWVCMDGLQHEQSSEQKLTLEKDYSLYFPHTAVVSDCYGYRFASPSAGNSVHSLMYLDCEGKVGYINSGYKCLGLRPVVCLKSDVSATKDVQGIWQLQ